MTQSPPPFFPFRALTAHINPVSASQSGYVLLGGCNPPKSKTQDFEDLQEGAIAKAAQPSEYVVHRSQDSEVNPQTGPKSHWAGLPIPNFCRLEIGVVPRLCYFPGNNKSVHCLLHKERNRTAATTIGDIC